MSLTSKSIVKLNGYQERHRLTAFVIAVIKKYNEDQAGRHAALLTYYTFLSLFPLLLIVTTVTDRIIGSNQHIRNSVLHGLTNYFPLMGNQLSNDIHTIHSTGFALVVGVLFSLYGTRGIANAFTRGVQDIWLVPQKQRGVFPHTLFKSLGIVVVGGSGLVLASIIASAASIAGHGLVYRLLSVVINVIILFLLFNFLLNFSLPKHITLKETRLGAASATIGLVILQILGGYILAHELKRLSALYSYFALTLGLLFWLYLQAQVLYYSIEVAVVSSQKLWPRSLDPSKTTPADEKLQLT